MKMQRVCALLLLYRFLFSKPDCNGNTFCGCHPELVEGLFVTRCFDKLSMTVMNGAVATKRLQWKAGLKYPKNSYFCFSKNIRNSTALETSEIFIKYLKRLATFGYDYASTLYKQTNEGGKNIYFK
ncbi:hypothetical protein [Pedobacter helvus]|uniref:Uncharacterized protein n=1 Tax=Pedobacter helvus TaxID=2563444 RepID=A0ABW9JP81_9SPHI|nr:hypothetical protein [Pedobacter ureilyticus]